ncbi:MAG: DUF4268 domain-containing protein, partial [Candidatus Binataceae bacterium]
PIVEQTGRPGAPAPAPHPDHSEAYRAFFQRVIDELRERHRFTTARTAQPQNWYTFASGINGVVYSIWFSTAGKIKIELYIDVGNRDLNHTIFEQLRFRMAEVEREFGGKLDWEWTEGRRACSIGIQASGKIDDSPEAVDKILKWSVDRLLRLKTVFGPRLMGFERALAQQMKKN